MCLTALRIQTLRLAWPLRASIAGAMALVSTVGRLFNIFGTRLDDRVKYLNVQNIWDWTRHGGNIK